MLHTTLEDVDSIYTVYTIINILIILCLLGLIGALMISVKITFLKIMASAISSFIILIGVLDILNKTVNSKEYLEGFSTVVTKTNTLYLDDYTLVKNDSRYLIISRQTGMVNEIGEDSYMRYELCYQIELVKFDYIKTLKGLIVSIDAPGTGYRIDCFSE